jgi:Tol biopolymer transport system component
MLDLVSGKVRQLTDLKAGFTVKNFDISPDGKRILFDRSRENSDIVLIDLPAR